MTTILILVGAALVLWLLGILALAWCFWKQADEDAWAVRDNWPPFVVARWMRWMERRRQR